MKYKFQLNEIVVIADTGGKGQVIARSEYLEASPTYLLRCESASGAAFELTYAQSSLIKKTEGGKQ